MRVDLRNNHRSIDPHFTARGRTCRVRLVARGRATARPTRDAVDRARESARDDARASKRNES
jgi:hypothetical protein